MADLLAARPTGGRPLRLAVLGAGPRALFSLEDLTVRLRGAPGRRPLHVQVIDPGPHPGVGAGYALDQPDCLRLNVDARLLDAPATGNGPSFPDWVRGAEPGLAEEPFPPRAVVGRYLAERWRRLVRDLSGIADVELVDGRAVGVDRGGVGATRVRVAPADGSAERVLDPVDEVLVVTGHASGHDGALGPVWSGAEPLVPAVLPAATLLSADRVPPGARVAVRGAALTFLDAALALTEGRGGRFRPRAEGHRELVHEASPEEPATILPTSREGLLLDAKPDPRRPLPAPVRRALERGAAALVEDLAEPGPDGPARVHDAVLRTATDVLLAADADRSPAAAQEAVAATLATGVEPDLRDGAGRAEAMLRRSVSVAEGTRTPGPAWALGRTWGALLPGVIAGLRGSDASEEDLLRFRRDARTLERLAFGPPLRTARRMLALLDSGTLDLGWLDRGVRITPEGVEAAPEPPADVVVDAVLPPPGVIGVKDPLVGSLLADAGLHVRRGRRGVHTAPDGTPIDAHGRPVPGLAVIGRAAEDEAIGHDTLNRHLHGEPAAWAERIAALLVPETVADPSPRPTPEASR